MEGIIGIGVMWYKYKNGNYVVFIDDSDGTKIRKSESGSFVPEFAESIDCLITSKCDGGCKFCYEGCTVNGKHADLRKYQYLLDTIKPYTELAINGNDLSHPDLEWFLTYMKSKRVIVNLTVSDRHFYKHLNTLKRYKAMGLIKGLGVSITDDSIIRNKEIKNFDNLVIHVVCGIISPYDLKNISEYLSNANLLILGYKKTGRGIEYYRDNASDIEHLTDYLKEELVELVTLYKTVSFDNLAIEQLKLREKLDIKDFNKIYMGGEGEFTYYIDFVNGQFAKTSFESRENRYSMEGYNSVDDMFKFIKFT